MINKIENQVDPNHQQKIEYDRVSLCEENKFDVIQLFESVKMNSQITYIDVQSLKSYLTYLFKDHNIDFTDIEIQHLLLRFSDKQNNKIYLHNFKDIVFPHTDLILVNHVLKDPDMKNGGPRNIISQSIQEKLKKIFQGELYYFSKINRYKIELHRDFEWDLANFPLCKIKELSKSILTQWLQENNVPEFLDCGESVWRRLKKMNRYQYLPELSISKDLFEFIQPDDYINFVSLNLQRPTSEDHFIKGKYHQQSDYLINQRNQPYITQDWKQSKVYQTSNMNFYNNSNNIKPYQSDVIQLEYQKYQNSKIKCEYKI